MLGTSVTLPFLAMIVAALFGLMLRGQNGLVWGAAFGFGVGCAIVIVVWAGFEIIRRMVE